MDYHLMQDTHWDPEVGAVLLIDKPLYWTSFDVVRKVRFLLKKQTGIKKLKVGHAGTLDPLATGLMVICAGKLTKQIDLFQAQTKEYVAEITLGKTTPSYDLETDYDADFQTDHITQSAVESVLERFIGEQDQIPPLYSAKFIDGKRAYELARQGRTDIEVKPSRVTLFELELLRFDLPVIEIRIVCSKGTYIRSLANDIGKALNSGAHLSALRRTASGDFSVNNALNMKKFQEIFSYLQIDQDKSE